MLYLLPAHYLFLHTEMMSYLSSITACQHWKTIITTVIDIYSVVVVNHCDVNMCLKQQKFMFTMFAMGTKFTKKLSYATFVIAITTS